MDSNALRSILTSWRGTRAQDNSRGSRDSRMDGGDEGANDLVVMDVETGAEGEDGLEDEDLDGEPFITDEGSLWRPRNEQKKPEDRSTMLVYPNALPYQCETLEQFDAQLELVMSRLADALRAKDYDVAFMQWTKQLDVLFSLKYPLRRDHRAALAKLLYEVAVLPGIDPRICDNAASLCTALIDNVKRIDIYDLRLDWRPMYETLVREIFPKRRKSGIVAVSNALLGLAEVAQRFYPPHEATEILETILPRFNGSNLNSCLATQTFLVNFLPLSHPNEWLDAVFALWKSVQSSYWDSAWLDLAARLASKHLDPSISDPRVATDLKARFSTTANGGLNGHAEMDAGGIERSRSPGIEADKTRWPGIKKDVSIFSATDWSFMMTKGLASLGVPIGGLGGVSMGNLADAKVIQNTLSMQRQGNKHYILALLIVSSIGSDGIAIRDLAKFIDATESFFHPSNASGTWGYTLGSFLQSLASTLAKRIHAEERPQCRTPQGWRLTREQRREFVTILRTPTLLGIFSKDHTLAISSHAALRTLAHIEPDLILPQVLERVYPALEGVLETHRTTSALTSLASLALVLSNRKLYPEGAKHLLPLCDLAVPGLDVNDPAKTITTCLFFCNAFTTVSLEDLTHPDLMTDMDTDETDESDNTIIRNSTSILPDLIERFIRGVLAVCDNLPEPGKAGRVGGKLEESMSNSLAAFMELLCTAMSPSLYDLALEIFYDHVARSPRANSSRIVGHLVGCYTRANAEKTLARFVPLCVQQITAELEGGASSVPSTSTLRYDEVDVALQWYAHLLGGVVGNAHGDAIKPYADKLIRLFKLMAEKCKSERGYTHAARLIGYAFCSPMLYYPLNVHFLNKTEREADSFRTEQHLSWGKLYEAKEVTVEWYMPSETAVDIAISVLKQLIEPALAQLEHLIHAPQAQKSTDRLWANEFCRHLAIVKAVLPGFGALIGVPSGDAEAAKASDSGDALPGFLDFTLLVETGNVLKDPQDPRYQYALGLRKRIASFLHEAVGRLKDSGTDDAFDCVRILISSIKAFCYEMPYDHNIHTSAKKSYEFVRSFTTHSTAQNRYPRAVWVRRAYLYHYTRLRASSVNRKRTVLDDLLLHDICDLCLSLSVSIRKSAQRALETLLRTFDGVRLMLQDRLLDALKPGVEADVMKGALYTLSLKQFHNYSILNWPSEPRYILSYLRAQHQEKQSIQKLITRSIFDYLQRLAEPQNLIYEIEAPKIDAAAEDVVEILMIPHDASLWKQVAQHRVARRRKLDETHAALVKDLLELASSSSTHHRYQAYALRFLRNLLRRDQPISIELVKYVCSQVLSELPTQRFWAFSTLSRILHYVKLRSLTVGDPLALLLQKSQNPLKVTITLEHPVSQQTSQRFVTDFAKDPTSDSILVEKASNGWLLWGHQLQGYRLPPQHERGLRWNAEHDAVLLVIRNALVERPFWDSVVKQFSQEVTREYMSAENTVFAKAIAVIFDDDELLDTLLPILEELLAEKDRHKQRAAIEMLGGLLRGTKHWSGDKRDRVWSWLTERLDAMLNSTTAETQPAFQMLVEYTLAERDPRRNAPFVKWLMGLKLDHRATQAFHQAKIGNCVVEAFRGMDWHSTAWVPPHLAIFDASIDSPFQEIRLAVSNGLVMLNWISSYPSFGSLDELVSKARSLASSKGRQLLIEPPADYKERLIATSAALGKWRAERQPSASGQQVYDEAASTVLYRMEAALQSHRLDSSYPIVEALMTDLFAMQELIDNEELSHQARDTLAMLGVMSYPAPIANDLLRNLIRLLSTSSSWRTRLDVLPILQPLFFFQLFVLDEDLIMQLLDVLCDVMRHPNLDVREAASKTLSGIVRCSQRTAILRLKERFLSVLRSTKLPRRRDSAGHEVMGYSEALTAAHSAVLGASALVSAFPYSVPSWLPSLLLEVGIMHASSPAPISTSVKRMLSEFKRSHQDSWAEDQKAFTADELLDLNDLYQGGSYYA